MTPNISVVIPTFNRSALLVNAIESVFAQTYSDYELIVIDDGSIDDTREALRPYMGRIKYFYQDNRGASAAQNKGIQVSDGNWVSILASDDVWHPSKLERQLAALAALGDGFGACFTDGIYVAHPDPSLPSSLFERAGLQTNAAFGELRDPFSFILKTYPAICVQSLLIRRSLLEALGGFDEAIGFAEDADLIFRLAFRTRFCYVATPLVSIDATPSRPRLTDFLVNKNDRLYQWFEYRYRKWLDLPELKDQTTREEIQSQLRILYYGWAITNLREGKVTAALSRIRKLRALGESDLSIFRTLLSKAGDRVYRLVQGLFE